MDYNKIHQWIELKVHLSFLHGLKDNPLVNRARENASFWRGLKENPPVDRVESLFEYIKRKSASELELNVYTPV